MNQKKFGFLRFINLSLYLGIIVVIAIGMSFFVGRFVVDTYQLSEMVFVAIMALGAFVGFAVIIKKLIDIGRE